MKRIYDKDETWFAVLWIIAYVLAFGNADSLSEAMGVPKLLTVPVGLVLSGVLFFFVRRHGLLSYYGLCPIRGAWREFGWFVPLLAISSVNFWNGVTLENAGPEMILYILSMCCVGFLEEIIFRGLLFRGMCKSGITSAIIISSVTFGMGHIVNLLLGAPLLATLLQLVYASAIGLCYTALFFTGGSLLPCILSHAFINSTSFFAVAPTAVGDVIITIVQTVLSLGYGLWLLRRRKNGLSE